MKAKSVFFAIVLAVDIIAVVAQLPACRDNPNFIFRPIGRPRDQQDCEWISQAGPSRVEIQCERRDVADNCPVTCGVCSITPSASPTNSPAPSPTPSGVPTFSVAPSDLPSLVPTTLPSNLPTTTPTDEFPTDSPIPSPAPTGIPTEGPTRTGTPTVEPSASQQPSHLPSGLASTSPSGEPSQLPSFQPTLSPSTPLPTTSYPSSTPSSIPSSAPTIPPPIEYLSVPQRKWSRVFSNANMGRGNGITVYQDNLYMTTQTGNLLVLSTETGQLDWTFSISDAIGQRRRNLQAGTIQCRSGVSFGTPLDGSGNFLTYAVMVEAQGGDPTTYVVAISIPNHSLLWISSPVAGEIQGTPVVTRGIGYSGQFVLFTHNTNLGQEPIGHFTMLQAQTNGTILYQEENFVALPYGPLGSSLRLERDLVMWITRAENGRGTVGQLRGFQIPPFYEPGDILQTLLLQNVDWNGITTPTLSRDSTNMFIGSSPLRAWVGERFDRAPSWSTQLMQSNTPLEPLPAAPVLSLDESRLYASSAANSFACLDSQTGNILWQVNTTSVLLTEAKVSPDDERVYSIQSRDGRVISMDPLTGEVNWALSCDIFEEDCGNSVSSEFALSEDGTVLYYGDVGGRIVAMQVGRQLVPTSQPSSAPSDLPSLPVSSTPSQQPTMPSTTTTATGTPSFQLSMTPSDPPSTTTSSSSPMPSDLPTLSTSEAPSRTMTPTWVGSSEQPTVANNPSPPAPGVIGGEDTDDNDKINGIGVGGLVLICVGSAGVVFTLCYLFVISKRKQREEPNRRNVDSISLEERNVVDSPAALVVAKADEEEPQTPKIARQISSSSSSVYLEEGGGESSSTPSETNLAPGKLSPLLTESEADPRFKRMDPQELTFGGTSAF